MLHGSNQQMVIENIERRAELKRKGSFASDGRKLALVIEGGGMRSVYSGAGAAALAQLGLVDVFDEVYATSAGVMNASYFISNQPSLGMSVYFENCPTWSFLNPWRFWKVLNVDYIIDRVAMIEKPLDIEFMMKSSSKLFVSVCDSRTGKLKLIDTKTTKTPLGQVLKAAMAIPVLYNRIVDVDDCPCIDSGTVVPFPLIEAVERKCTDILVLQTRHARFAEKRPSAVQQYLFKMLHAFGRDDLKVAFAGRHTASQYVRDVALGRVEPPVGVNVASLCPDESDGVESTTTNPKVTFEAAIRYGRKTFAAFGKNPDAFVLAPLKATRQARNSQ